MLLPEVEAAGSVNFPSPLLLVRAHASDAGQPALKRTEEWQQTRDSRDLLNVFLIHGRYHINLRRTN